MASRRASLPGAAELFRSTSAPAVQPVPDAAVPDPDRTAPAAAPRRSRNVDGRGPDRRSPSGRERHEEKITVYCSPAELLDIETARLTLRAEHGIGVDRGRIVREALAVVLADLDAHGADSTLVRRLRRDEQ